MKLVPDTSVVIDGRITSLIKTGEYTGATIIIPEAVVAELEAQANQGREIGFSGLTELQALCKLAGEGVISLTFTGVRPSLEQVKLASGGEIDALIRNAAIEHEAQFITSDVVQAEVARAKGLDVVYLRPQIEGFAPLGIDQFFDEHTISVYLKERVAPMARKGTVKEMQLVRLRDQPMSDYELRNLSQEILERAKRDPDGFIEIERRGITVVQIGSMRIAIARRPFSDGMEITAVRPIADVTLESFAKAPVIKNRIMGEKRGLLVAGPPGAGKTTLAQSIATYLADNGFIVKTMEAPRELQVPDHITQYSGLEGSMQNTADVLMLVRPDFVIFDELRKNEDFRVFADMRLAGIGMVGVVHAIGIHDALQRLSDRVEFGVLPRVVNTIIFVDKGEITNVYDLGFTIKVPEGMSSEINLRPVTTLSDYETGELLFEIFKYDSETIVMPVIRPLAAAAPLKPPVIQKEPAESSSWKIIERDIQREIGRYTDGYVEVQMLSDSKAVVYIEDKDVPAAIGKGGKNIAGIVNKVGIGIDIRPRSELEKPPSAPAPEEELQLGGGVKIRMEKKQLAIICPEQAGKIVDVFAGKEYLFTATVNDSGEIHLAKNSSIAQEMIKRYNDGDTIRLRPV
ncbi:MAG: Flp pilus assembly complex ATPase component [Methanomicrobiales archaeon]|nr:Flp pilus assembly complex ATPase component [Methanomicrobiales archaeon]